MSMDNVKLHGASHDAGNNRVVIDFLVKVAGIAACKLHSAKVVDVHVVEVGIQMVAQTEIEVRVHDVTHTVANVVVADVAPGNRHRIHGHNLAGRAVLVAEGFGQTERDVHVALCVQTLRNTIVSCGESTKYVRRILPSKH